METMKESSTAVAMMVLQTSSHMASGSDRVEGVRGQKETPCKPSLDNNGQTVISPLIDISYLEISLGMLFHYLRIWVVLWVNTWKQLTLYIILLTEAFFRVAVAGSIASSNARHDALLMTSDNGFN